MYMTKIPFMNHVIRGGVVRREDTGYLLACNPNQEETHPHAKIVKWNLGIFTESTAKFNAHSICLVSKPDVALVFLSSEGFYGVHSKEAIGGNIFHNSQPRPADPRYGSFRSVSEIGGKAYAVGLRGMVYRLDNFTKWTRIDESLSSEFDPQAAHGFDDSQIYAAGFGGQLWQFDGRKWIRRELPTNVNLTSVKCAGDGMVYVAGHKGILICGRNHAWKMIDHGAMTADVWGLEWFQERLYLSTMTKVFRLEGEELEPVNFGEDPPKSCYQLSAAKDVLWSIGERDVMSFDGKTWSRIV
jgi:hypothetical protein